MFSRGYKPGSKVKQAIALGKQQNFEQGVRDRAQERMRQDTSQCIRRNLDRKRK